MRAWREYMTSCRSLFNVSALVARLEELAFAEDRGPDPATKDRATDFEGVEDSGGTNPLANARTIGRIGSRKFGQSVRSNQSREVSE